MKTLTVKSTPYFLKVDGFNAHKYGGSVFEMAQNGEFSSVLFFNLTIFLQPFELTIRFIRA